MKRRLFPFVALLALFWPVAVPHAQTMSGSMGAAAPGAETGPGRAGTPAAPADPDMMAGMATMQRDMAAAPMTGDPDRDFVSMMMPHHRGAIAMAEAELRDGHDPAMRALARRIVADQQREVTEMRSWQAEHAGR